MIISTSQIVGSVLLATSLNNPVCGSIPFSYCFGRTAIYSYNGTLLGEKQQESYARLDELAAYKADWNGNGANPFATELINICKDIINELRYQPEIYPTAIGAIQFEYDKDDGSYIEFEVYPDKANVYRKDPSGKANSMTIKLSDIKKEVDAFYEGQ